MIFLWPIGLIFILAIIPLILLHRRKTPIYMISSIYYYTRLAPIKSMIALKPKWIWERLLPILAIIFISISISEPIFIKNTKELLVVIDTTASMCAYHSKNKTRLDIIKEKIKAQLVHNDKKITLLEINSKLEFPPANLDPVKWLEQLKCTDEIDNNNNQIVNSIILMKFINTRDMIIGTDIFIPNAPKNIQVINHTSIDKETTISQKNNYENIAISDISISKNVFHGEKEKSIKVSNYGEKTASFDIVAQKIDIGKCASNEPVLIAKEDNLSARQTKKYVIPDIIGNSFALSIDNKLNRSNKNNLSLEKNISDNYFESDILKSDSAIYVYHEEEAKTDIAFLGDVDKSPWKELSKLSHLYTQEAPYSCSNDKILSEFNFIIAPICNNTTSNNDYKKEAESIQHGISKNKYGLYWQPSIDSNSGIKADMDTSFVYDTETNQDISYIKNIFKNISPFENVLLPSALLLDVPKNAYSFIAPHNNDQKNKTLGYIETNNRQKNIFLSFDIEALCNHKDNRYHQEACLAITSMIGNMIGDSINDDGNSDLKNNQLKSKPIELFGKTSLWDHCFIDKNNWLKNSLNNEAPHKTGIYYKKDLSSMRVINMISSKESDLTPKTVSLSQKNNIDDLSKQDSLLLSKFFFIFSSFCLAIYTLIYPKQQSLSGKS